MESDKNSGVVENQYSKGGKRCKALSLCVTAVCADLGPWSWSGTDTVVTSWPVLYIVSKVCRCANRKSHRILGEKGGGGGGGGEGSRPGQIMEFLLCVETD